MITRRKLIFSGGAAIASAPFVARASVTPVLGLSLPLTGVQAANAQDMLEGYQLASAAMGNSFRIEVLDDGSDPARTVENIKKIEAMGVLATSGIIGTPHAQAAVPVASAAGLPVIGMRSGASSLRNGDPGVFHMRSSFDAELIRLATIIAGGGNKSVNILYSDDSFGKSSVKTMEVALNKLGVAAPNPVAVSRNGENLASSVDLLAIRAKAEKEQSAIVLLVIAGPFIEATRLLREKHKVIMPILGMSHVVNRKLISESNAGFAGLGVMLAFPLPRVNKDLVAQKYRSIAIASKKPELIESLSVFEGFFYGMTFGAAVREIGAGGGRKDLASAMRKGFSYDGLTVSMNSKNEGYGFIDVAYKNSVTGKLHT